MTASTNSDASISLTVDYKWDSAKGGLIASTVVADAQITSNINLELKKGGSVASKYIEIGKLYVPIKLTLYDYILNKVGVHVAGFYIPYGVTLDGSIAFNASTAVTNKINGKAVPFPVAT